MCVLASTILNLRDFICICVVTDGHSTEVAVHGTNCAFCPGHRIILVVRLDRLCEVDADGKDNEENNCENCYRDNYGCYVCKKQLIIINIKLIIFSTFHVLLNYTPFQLNMKIFERVIYSTPKETHHLYAITVVKKFNWR